MDFFESLLDVLVLAIPAAFVFLQIFLCFRVRRLWLRLLPSILFFILALALFVLTWLTNGWDALGYLLLALGALLLLLSVGLGWATWGLVLFLKKLKAMRS